MLSSFNFDGSVHSFSQNLVCGGILWDHRGVMAAACAGVMLTMNTIGAELLSLFKGFHLRCSENLSGH